ncbi:radical SAM/SPASM domain-containing protein [Candidatus Harpocratesius sp.]
MNSFSLKTLQIEITTKCNFDCAMCLHSQNSLERNEISVDLFKKIAKEVFSGLDHLILYGVGEPLTHSNFLKLLEISRIYLPPHAKIEFTSNGSLLAADFLEEILKYKVDRIIISLDSPFLAKSSKIREGFNPEVFKNLKVLAEAYQARKIPNLAIETVISNQNLYDLSYLVEFCAEIGIPKIFLSHLLPYTVEMEKDSLFLPISADAFDLLNNVGELGWEILNQVILTPNYHKFINTEHNSQIQQMLNSISEAQINNIDFDLQKIMDVIQKKQTIKNAQHVFKEISKLAEKNHILIDLPPLFAESTQRECPFAARDGLFISFDGNVIPCYNFGHEHKVVINHHERLVKPYILGNLTNPNTSFKDILQSSKVKQIHSVLNCISSQVPFCGDCVYSTQNCYYITDNSSDCYGNTPGCNECLYSVGFVKCLFDI